MDAYKVVGLTCDKDNNKIPYLDALTRLIEYVVVGRVLQHLCQSFSSTYFLVLHKDPEDKTKLRLLGIGTALRRIVPAHL